jgi:hypothetical protein
VPPIISTMRFGCSLALPMVWLQVSAAKASSIMHFNNALLESYILHARMLLDFLYAERPKEDYVIAEDFFEDLIKWHNTKPQKPEKV